MIPAAPGAPLASFVLPQWNLLQALTQWCCEPSKLLEPLPLDQHPEGSGFLRVAVVSPERPLTSCGGEGARGVSSRCPLSLWPAAVSPGAATASSKLGGVLFSCVYFSVIVSTPSCPGSVPGVRHSG
ncbi:hypothetical protein HJG60_008408 [Phyllostomus discolor]|uniref:Uncharacterized protein n=1 Tax=Phyllostomus discolor TaxID=89673 RepID=A0A833Z1I6_9CHIR|nr:hypothetical protein HJG60_008408 [Phyllostomus discolor]